MADIYSVLLFVICVLLAILGVSWWVIERDLKDK